MDERRVIPVCQHGEVINCVETMPDGSRRPCSLRPMEDGKPILGELVSVEPCADGSLKLRTLYSTSGPPQVATPAYRSGWDATFGRGARGQA